MLLKLQKGNKRITAIVRALEEISLRLLIIPIIRKAITLRIF